MNVHPVPPDEKPEPPKVHTYIIEPWDFRMHGRSLLWVVPGHAQFYGYPN